MNQQTDDERIPTLTDIIQPGNESMKNHFDKTFFDDDHGLEEDEQLEALFEEKPTEIPTIDVILSELKEQPTHPHASPPGKG